jgi:hypothetical protein
MEQSSQSDGIHLVKKFYTLHCTESETCDSLTRELDGRLMNFTVHNVP